jgi:hypothetical protein
MCITPDLDGWERSGISWIKQGRFRLIEHHIAIPSPEVSNQAQTHLRRAMDQTAKAERVQVKVTTYGFHLQNITSYSMVNSKIYRTEIHLEIH